jgi:excinuclease ABC subunit A
MKYIKIKGAREHNLKNINVDIPRDKLVVITGLSGSGKSTLAFDTLYAEGQRRYVESLSAYARQFLGLMNKPDCDSIEGLSPAISIEQKTTSKNPRSTVGTVTEIYDYLRLLYARVGTAYCPIHDVAIQKRSPQKIAQMIYEEHKGSVIILSPIVRQKKGTYEKIAEDLKKEGFSKIRVNGTIQKTDEKLNLERYKKHDIEILIDKFDLKDTSRLSESVELALQKSGGLVYVLNEKNNLKIYSSLLACPHCDFSVEELQPRMFSFNSPFGACKECHGLGIKMEFDPDLLIPDKSLSIVDGAIAAYRNVIGSWRIKQLGAFAKEHGFSLMTPVKDLKKSQLDKILYGHGEEPYKYVDEFEGVVLQTQRLYHQTESDYRKRDMERFMRIKECPKCKGKRLSPTALAVKISGKSIIDVTDMSIVYAKDFFSNIKLTKKQIEIAKLILKEINVRLSFLERVGLSYLTLSRNAGTLSGGEAQRIRLATQIGSNLMGVIYILDEPSIGLHQRDNEKLIETLKNLRDVGNTLIVVEHDEETIRNADHVIDIGPGAGVHGGKIVSQGNPKEIENKNSLTGKYMSGKLKIDVPNKRRTAKGEIIIKGAKENNLKNIDVKIPQKVLTCVTGVSGSGKSTLIHEILYKAASKKINKSKEIPGNHDSIEFGDVDKVVIIDQSPIGRTPRSNPATYTKVFDEIRKVFAATKEAKLRGYQAGRFSFNVKGGRCENCKGEGLIKIEMNFLPDVYVDCEECKGTRFNKETLEVKYKDKNISEVLNMSVEEALSFFKALPLISHKIETLENVGLGYVKLGQSSTTLSGGEAQRIKLTRELSKRSTGNTLYILDEPTTGLHFHDVKRLINVLNNLVDKKNTMIVIEHNLDVIKSADWIIDLGPEGGDKGGEIVAQGTPENIAKIKESHTGRFIKKIL